MKARGGDNRAGLGGRAGRSDASLSSAGSCRKQDMARYPLPAERVDLPDERSSACRRSDSVLEVMSLRRSGLPSRSTAASLRQFRHGNPPQSTPPAPAKCK